MSNYKVFFPENCGYKIVFLALMIVFVGCSSEKKATLMRNMLTLKDSYCKPIDAYDYDFNYPSKNSDSILNANKNLNKYFTFQSILILNALGCLDEAQKIINRKNYHTYEAEINTLVLKNKIDGKVNIALTELSAVTAQFDCEGERVEQMASYLDNLNSIRTNRLIITSLVAGAVAAIVGGIVSDNNWKNSAQIGGGVIGAGFGLALLNPKGKKVDFFHHHNLLRDIWQNKLTDTNFPPFIWYMYTEKKFSPVEGISMIQNIRNRWLEYQFEGDTTKANKSVIFSNGGKYYSEDLHNRVAMLNQMQSITRTINQDINYLLLDLDKLLYADQDSK
jgi:hypothetical protein